MLISTTYKNLVWTNWEENPAEPKYSYTLLEPHTAMTFTSPVGFQTTGENGLFQQYYLTTSH